MYIDQWAREPGTNWNSLYSYVPIGSVSATDTFELDEDVRHISTHPGDVIRVARTDGGFTDYETITHEDLRYRNTGNYVARIGTTLVFNNAFTAGQAEVGGTIYVPAYGNPEHIENDNDEVPVDDPMWLVLITAAELVRNDVTRQNQYPNLIAEANTLMQRMKDDNDSTQDSRAHTESFLLSENW